MDRNKRKKLVKKKLAKQKVHEKMLDSHKKHKWETVILPELLKNKIKEDEQSEQEVSN